MRKKIIFLHGAGCGPDIWKELTSYFSDHEIHLLALHKIPQHQNSERDYLKVIWDYLEKKEISKAYFCGHSMGGALSMLMALKYPEKVSGLIILNSGAKLKVHPTIYRWLQKPFLKYLALIITAWASGIQMRSRKVILKELFCSQRILQDLDFCNKIDLTQHLGEIKVPTLILTGDKDPLTPKRYTYFLQKKIKAAQSKIIAGGHFSMIESPKKVYEAITSWFEREF